MDSGELSNNNNNEAEMVSLRPNCASKFFSAQDSVLVSEESIEDDAPSKRKRLASTSEDIAQNFLHTQRKAHQDKGFFSSLSPKSNISYSKSKIFRMNSTVGISLEQKIKASQLADQHCSKIFSLKSSNGISTENCDLFQLPPAKTMFTCPSWEIKELQQLKTELNKVKGGTERGEDMLSWTDHTFRVNPAATVFRRVKAKANPEFMSQAFLKFYEILNQFPLVKLDSKGLGSVHLCEAPGAFIVALNHYIQLHHPEMQWKWLGNTLHPHYEGCQASECIPDDRIILHTLEHWVFGRDGTGNITLRSCLDELLERCRSLGQPVSLVTADGSIDCQSNPGEQETMTNHLFVCEVHAALRMLCSGGSLVLKMFTFFESSSLCLLYLICCVFKEVNVFKPITSKLGNSEVYVVCLDYVGRDAIPDILDQIRKQYHPQGFATSMFAPSEIPEKFVQLVTQCAIFFKEHQENAIERNARLYSESNDETEATCQLVQEFVWDKFEERNPLEPIPAARHILQVDVKWDPHVHPDFGKHRKWSRCFHRFTTEKKISYVSELLQDLIQQYSYREHKELYFVCDEVITESLRISRGLPFNIIGNSRFCFDRCLNLYLTLINLKNELFGVKLMDAMDKCESQKVIYWDGKDKANDASHLLDVTDETKLLVDSIKKDYPGCQFLIGEHPQRDIGPNSSCHVLELLYDMLSKDSLPLNATIHLTNMSLLTRLQNGLFTVLSSCFEDVDLHQTLYYYLESGNHVSPVLKLKKLNVDSARCVVNALRVSGWSPGSQKKGVLEVVDALNLIHCKSHEVVCRYNANLLLLWVRDEEVAEILVGHALSRTVLSCSSEGLAVVHSLAYLGAVYSFGFLLSRTGKKLFFLTVATGLEHQFLKANMTIDAHDSSTPLSHKAYELSTEDEERLGDLFKKLDANGDGKIDVSDLSKGLKMLNLPHFPGHMEKIIQKADVNQSNDLTLAEFVNYVQQHEKKLRLTFNKLDANKDGRVDEGELISSFDALGIGITREEARGLLRRLQCGGVVWCVCYTSHSGVVWCVCYTPHSGVVWCACYTPHSGVVWCACYTPHSGVVWCVMCLLHTTQWCCVVLCGVPATHHTVVLCGVSATYHTVVLCGVWCACYTPHSGVVWCVMCLLHTTQWCCVVCDVSATHHTVVSRVVCKLSVKLPRVARGARVAHRTRVARGTRVAHRTRVARGARGLHEALLEVGDTELPAVFITRLYGFTGKHRD
ncbi:Ribosomal RNA methyltransferase FtsJ domain [Trinorchestia longiramus]|nr:Ribosomal RNA methyltransferase FtsJ domain [Trinorchestia longiramus]